MGPLRVTIDGLRALSAHCEVLAGQLSVNASSVAVSPGEGSAAAVAACDGRIVAAGEKLADWTRGTARSVNSAADAYQHQDDASAAELETTVV